MIRYIALGTILALATLSTAALAAGENAPNESGLVLSAVQRNPNAVLHKPEHQDKETRVVGIVNGMVNKLTNLSQRLENQLIAAKRLAPSANATAALETAVRSAQQIISATIQSLQTIPESDKPTALIPDIKEHITMFKNRVEAVRLEMIKFHQSL